MWWCRWLRSIVWWFVVVQPSPSLPQRSRGDDIKDVQCCCNGVHFPLVVCKKIPQTVRGRLCEDGIVPTVGVVVVVVVGMGGVVVWWVPPIVALVWVWVGVVVVLVVVEKEDEGGDIQGVVIESMEEGGGGNVLIISLV